MADATITSPRVCRKCGQSYPATLEHFRHEPKTKLGLKTQCRECEREYRRKRRAADPDEDRRYYLSLSEDRKREYAERAKARRAANIEAARRQETEYRRRNAEKNREWQARYRDKNREREREKARLRRLENPERERARLNALNRAKRQTAQGGLALRMGNLMRHSFRAVCAGGVSVKRNRTWLSLVDYSLDDLMRHIERQFQRGMTWKNFGEWHIDHIRPIASFSFSSPECTGFKECWALTNLRPMWAEENRRKNANRILLI